MKINPKELTKILQLVQPGLCKRTVLNQAKHFVFTGQDVITFNDQISIKHLFQTDFPFSVSADEFYSVISKIKHETCEIEIEGESIIISAKNTKSKLSISTDSYLISVVNNIKIPNKGWAFLPDNFIDAISLCYFSASKDMTQGALSCLSIKDDKVFASDSIRIGFYKMSGVMSDEQILIPATIISELKKYPIVEFLVDDQWIHFRTTENIIFSSRILDAEFPDCLPFFNIKGSELILPISLKEIIEECKEFYESQNDPSSKITISLDGKYLKCFSSKTNGWIEKKIIFPTDNKISFSINPVLFIEILEKTTKMIISLEEQKALFISDNFKHIMCLPC